MSRPVELRCNAPHPRIRKAECGAKVADVLAGSVAIIPAGRLAPGCVLLRCRRCGAEYVLCPIPRAA